MLMLPEVAQIILNIMMMSYVSCYGELYMT